MQVEIITNFKLVECFQYSSVCISNGRSSYIVCWSARKRFLQKHSSIPKCYSILHLLCWYCYSILWRYILHRTHIYWSETVRFAIFLWYLVLLMIKRFVLERSSPLACGLRARRTLTCNLSWRSADRSSLRTSWIFRIFFALFDEQNPFMHGRWWTSVCGWVKNCWKFAVSLHCLP